MTIEIILNYDNIYIIFCIYCHKEVYPYVTEIRITLSADLLTEAIYLDIQEAFISYNIDIENNFRNRFLFPLALVLMCCNY